VLRAELSAGCAILPCPAVTISLKSIFQTKLPEKTFRVATNFTAQSEKSHFWPPRLLTWATINKETLP
jgi:hypothetical protein